MAENEDLQYEEFEDASVSSMKGHINMNTSKYYWNEKELPY